MRLRSTLLFFLGIFVCVALSSVRLATAQTDAAMISGQIVDSSGAIVRGASVELHNMLQGTITATTTNEAGIYVFPSVQPGQYSITVRRQGFKQVDLVDLVANTQAHIEQNFKLQIGSVSESVTVSGSATNDSPAVGMTVEREFIENMPLNGRSLQDLIQLAPGTVSTGEYYSIDGQRTDGNNFTVDGVSANLGGVINSTSGQDGGASGSTPSQTVVGTTQNLVSIDALQEFTIQTSGYTAEYGRNPGGQVQFTTRSGTNDLHGTLFEYLRNTAFDAKSFQEDYYDEPKSAEHQNDFGGTVGGPLVIPKLYDGKDKTFFFTSYEGLRLLTPAFDSDYVPTEAFRNWASPGVQPYLNSIPLPNPNSPGNQDGCGIPDSLTGLPIACDALYTRSYSNPSNVDNIGVRFDQNFSQRWHIFLRYADTPSSTSYQNEQQLDKRQINAHTWTAGLTSNIRSALLNELRFNYSRDAEGGFNTQQAVAGAIPLARALLIPPAYDGTYAGGDFFAYVPGSSLLVNSPYGAYGSVQSQYQIVDSFAWTRGNHSLKFGGDWRRLTPTVLSGATYSSFVLLESLNAINQGYADGGVQASAEQPGAPVFHNLSLFAQDHWRIGRRLSIDYGVRWEFNPPPGPSNGHYPATLTSNDLATAILAPAGTAPYKTNYNHFAPRLGFAWNAIPAAQHTLTVRGGFGIFYDTAQQTIGVAYTQAYPFSVNGPTLANVPFPLSAAALAPPSLNVPLTPPYGYLADVTSSNLTLPYAEQWNLSIDEALNSKNTLTISYVANEGKKLLFSGLYQAGAGNSVNPNFANGITYTYNGSSSNYNALQIQDRGTITKGLDFVGSFTWAHALDSASNNYGGGLPSPLYGNSDNDLRKVLNVAVNYQIPAASSSRWERVLTGGWIIANRFSTQSGYPLQIYQDTFVPLPDGGFQNYVPDLVPGVPVYLHGSAADLNGQPVPGDWRLNPAAFAVVPTDPTTGLPVRQGTLGRNFVRGPSFCTLNAAVQRSFPIYEQLHLVFRVEAFNILNHPSLNGVDESLSDSTFGQLVGGNVTTIGVPNQLYAMGAARSLQLSLKLQF